MMALCLRSALIRACDRHAKTLRAALETEKPARGKPDGLGVSAPPPNLRGGGTSEDGRGRRGRPAQKLGRQKTCGASGAGRGKSPRGQKPSERQTPPEGETSAEAQRRQTLSEGKTSAKAKPPPGKNPPEEKTLRGQNLSGGKTSRVTVGYTRIEPSYRENKNLKIERLSLDVTYRNPKGGVLCVCTGLQPSAIEGPLRALAGHITPGRA